MLAIHNGGSWNSRWLSYCEEKSIPHVAVDGYSSSVLQSLRSCKAFLWHFHHNDPTDLLVAPSILAAAAHAGLQVYPDHPTRWHFDDKIAQKHLFDAAGLSTPDTWVFLSREQALRFASDCKVPIVAKLRRGAGSHNVRLLRSRGEVRSYINRMFRRGMAASMGPLTDVQRKLVAARSGGTRGLVQAAQRVPSYMRVVRHARRLQPIERGYVYFQEFIPGNVTDLRVSVIGDRAWGFHRAVRQGDFRASGSGLVDYDPAKVPLKMIQVSFDAAAMLKMQSAHFDWVRRPGGDYVLLEVSYATPDALVYNAPGYWNRDLKWRSGNFYPSLAVLEDLIASVGYATAGSSHSGLR